MTLELSVGTIAASTSVLAAVGGGIVAFIRMLFKGDLQEHKLYVAENYVNKDALNHALEPLKTQLDRIEKDIREERKRKRRF